MDNITQSYAYHLDNLRREYKIKEKDLCFGIVDTRTYRRYLSGDRTLTHIKILAFCERLKISPSDFYYGASQRDRLEISRIRKVYNMILSLDFDSFDREIVLIKKQRLISSQSIRFLDFCICRADYLRKSKNIVDIKLKISEIIDYPNCLNKNAFDFVELGGLLLIAEIEVAKNNFTALTKLSSILSDYNLIYINSESSQILPTIYSNTSLFLARNKMYEKSYSLSGKGIEYSNLYSNNSGLALLYYIKSYSAKMLNNSEEAEINAIKCLMTSITRNDKLKIEMFTKSLIKDFDFNPLFLVKKYNKQLFMIDKSNN